MIFLRINVAKDTHNCFIISSEGEVLSDVFTILSSMDCFRRLLQRIQGRCSPQDKIKVGLEATGHYSYNILGLISTTVFPPPTTTREVTDEMPTKSLELRHTIYLSGN